LGLARSWIYQFKIAQANADFVLRYEDLIRDVPAAISSMAQKLECGVISDELVHQVLMPPEDSQSTSSYSEDSLLHKQHITGTVAGDWRVVLDQDLQRQLDAEFGWWFDQNGYERL
jgi:hypothetical protein